MQQYAKRFIALTSLLFVVFFLDLSTGSVAIPTMKVLKAVLGVELEQQVWMHIIEKIRLPKALTAVLSGSALSVSGLQMQTLFRNPLAGPGVLGIAAGSSLGVALVMLAGGNATKIDLIHQLNLSGSALLILSAVAGACLVMLFIVLVAWRVKESVVLLIVGMMVGNITLAIVSIWQYFSEPEQIQRFLIWTFGSLGGVAVEHLFILIPCVAVGLFIAFIISSPLNALLLGEHYAQSMGLSVPSLRLIIILNTGLLTGAITAFCGPIGFVGVAIPHIGRVLFRTADHHILVLACILLGAFVMLCCDIITYFPANQSILPINAITALFGSPVVIWMILKKNSSFF